MIRNVFALCAVVALSACSGGGSTPAPSVAQTPTPGSMQVSQSGTAISALSFSVTGQSAATTIAISQAGYDNGPFQETNTCSSGTAPVATIAQPSAGSTYVVTPMNAGACTITFTGGANTTIVLPVTVTLTQVPIN